MIIELKKKSKCFKQKYRYLTLGINYLVVEVSNSYYRILDDENKPFSYPKSLFRIVDATLPPNWSYLTYNNCYYLTHKEINKVGFFEDYFDDVPYAVASLRLVINELKKHHCLEPESLRSKSTR